MVVEGHAGRNHIDHRRAFVSDGGLQDGKQLFLVAGEGARNKSRAKLDGHDAGIDGWQIVNDAGLQFCANIGCGRELSFGQAVDAVIFNHVNKRQVAAHQVNKLADADGGGIAIAADAKRHELAVGQGNASGDGRHAAMNSIEAVRVVEKVCGTLGRASDAGELGHKFRLDSHLIHGVDDAFRDGIVSAAGAERGFSTAIVDYRQADVVGFGRGRGWSRRHLLALLGNDLVRQRAGVNRQAVVVPDAAQLNYLLRRQIELEQLKHLRIAVLLHNIDPVVVLYEIVDIMVERIGTDAQVVSLHAEFLA